MRVWAAAATVLCIMLGGTPAGAAVASSIHEPAVDVAATPSGWVPVDYGDARVSIPPSWTTQDWGGSCATGPSGTLLLGAQAACLPGSTPGVYPTIAQLSNWHGSVPNGEPPRVVNGIAAYAPGVEALYAVPRLGVSLYLSGSYPPGILSSLTYSPRAVVTAPGPYPRVPKTWHRYTWDHVSVAVPPTWPLHQRGGSPPSCVSNAALPFAGVTLTDKPELPLPCPAPLLYRHTGSASSPAGVEIDSYGLDFVPAGQCAPERFHGLPMCVSTEDSYDDFVALVYPPHRHPVAVQLGLAGNGEMDRTVLGSLRITPSA